MKTIKGLSFVALLALASCGHPKTTNSRVTNEKPSESGKTVGGDLSLTESVRKIMSESHVAVPDTNPQLMTAMKAVVQIQITKPRCRDINEDPTTLSRSRPLNDEVSYCTGTVINYNGKPYVITASHCLVTSCINNNSSKLGLSPNINGTYNKPPTLAGIKIPSKVIEPIISGSTSSFMPMDDFNWADSTKYATAKAVEFVTGPVPSSPGMTFHGGLEGFKTSGLCQARTVNPDGTTMSENGFYKTSYDVAVIDFGLALGSYPMIPIPSAAFITNKTYATETVAGVSVAKYRFVGISNSDYTTDDFQHFQKSWHPANRDVCLAVQDAARLLGAETSNIFASTYGTGANFVGGSNTQDSFSMSLGVSGCPGDSGHPIFEEVPKVGGGYDYVLAGIGSVGHVLPSRLTSGAGTPRQRACSVSSGTYSSVKPADINVALAKMVAKTIPLFPANSPKNPKTPTTFVDLWYPEYGQFIEEENERKFYALAIAAPAVISNSTTVLWKALTKSDGVTKVASQSIGQPLMAIATDGLGQRKATWKAASLPYGYYKVDIQFPINIQSASCLVAQYETNPLRGKTTLGSKVMTILPEGSSTFNLGAYSANEIAVGDPVRGTGIPAGTRVAIAPASRTSSTFTMSLAATATSATTGTPLIVTHTFRNRVDQKTGANTDINQFSNTTLNLLPFKRTVVTSSPFEYYIWVPALATTINNGSATVILNDKGCGTATASAGRMTADTVIFTSQSRIK